MKHPKDIQAFGKHLRKIRLERNLSQQHLADMANVPKITIQRIELAKYSIKLDTLISISKALEISLSEIVAYSNNPE